MENSALLSQPAYLLIIASVCILGGIALFMYSILKREHDIQSKEEDTFNRYHKIINNAHNEARAIIDTTAVASTGILADSHATSEHLSEDLDKVLQSIATQHIEYLKKSSEEFNKSYDDKLIKLQEQLAGHTEQSIRDSEKRLNESLEKYMQPVMESAANSHTVIEQRTQELINQVEKELADYKQARMTKIESEVKDLVHKTYKEVLRKSIPDSLQEELILESLEKAKTEGGISL
jgi:hypothetical protein